jgi:hypothetical protein
VRRVRDRKHRPVQLPSLQFSFGAHGKFARIPGFPVTRHLSLSTRYQPVRFGN